MTESAGSGLSRVGGVARYLVAVALMGMLVAASVALLSTAGSAVVHAGTAAPVGEINLDPLSQRSVVQAADGSMLAVLHREENRKSVPLADVPQVVVDSVLAVEDRDFYSHGGMNLRATTRALVTNVSAGEVLQGGSTITQQLVKNALLTPKQDLGRKVQEAVLSLRLEDQMTKDQILERYLNTVYFGNGAYGVQAAAELYFGVGVEQLGQPEGAFLAGLIRNPIGYDPFAYPQASTDRRDLVVERLEVLGRIDRPTGDAIRATPVPSERRNQELLPKPEDYFVEEVTQRLLDDPRLGDTQAARYNAVFRGGLTIKTTLDPRLQGLAEEAVASTVPDPTGQFTASVVTVEPGTGAVRALVGGRGFQTDKVDIATQGVGQQPGSAFKPFVLATALEQGISPQATIDGRGPCTLPNPGGEPDPYPVENFEGSSGGVLTLADATRNSVNCAYAKLGLVVGLDKVADTARRMGITTPLPADRPSMSLGALEVLPIDMAGAYATFAADGMHYAPYLIDEVLDIDGESLFRGPSTGEQVISVDTARLATSVLQEVVNAGTATRARFPDRRPAAGKTGTTSAYSDAWFVGYVPQLATAVWMGAPEGNVEMRNVGGIRVTGGSYPARIWQAYMGPAMAGQPVVAFPDPPAAGDSTYLRLPVDEPASPRQSVSRGSDVVAAPTHKSPQPTKSSAPRSRGVPVPTVPETDRPEVAVPRPQPPSSGGGGSDGPRVPPSGGGAPGGGSSGGGGALGGGSGPPGWPAGFPPYPGA
ncbi:MAG: transglycosylase domain-containing protein [Acidimicrobiales bacterium]